MNDTAGSRPKGACRPTGRALLAVAWLMGCGLAAAQTPATPAPFSVVADGIPASLTSVPGDPARGRAVVVNRPLGLCLLCHSGPFPEERFQGDLAPSLAGAGGRWSTAQLRLRLVDSRRVQPDSIMPAYHRTAGLTRVSTAWQGRPILSAQQIEDVVAFLATLHD
jgi:sulfur-oxidizing protein SoxX